jgi:iron complex outermembrane receptor protein
VPIQRTTGIVLALGLIVLAGARAGRADQDEGDTAVAPPPPDDASGDDAPPSDSPPAPGSRFSLEDIIFARVPQPVSATRNEVPVTRAPSSVTVIEGSELRRSGARFLSDALRIVPGLEVMRTSSTESNVNARGFHDAPSTAQGMLALIDGRLAYNEFFGNVLWDALPVSMADIDRVEVIRGPGSFVHGPNAMHGLVNIVTRSPLQYDRDVLHVSAGGGSYDSSVASMTYVRREEDAGFKATLGWDDIGEFEGNDDTSGKKFLEFRFEKRLDSDHRIEVTGGAIERELGVLIPTTGGIPATNLLNDLQETFVKVNYSAGELEAQLFWTGIDTTSRPDRFYSPFDVDHDTVDLDVQYSTTPWDGHDLTLGAGYRFATFETENPDVADGRHDTNLGWGFIQDEVEIATDLFVTAGVRLDWHSTSGLNVSPRIAAVWEFEDEQYLRASAGFGFRNPSLREIWFDMPVNLPGLPAPVIFTGNDDLDAEKMRAFELGYYGAPTDRLKAGVNLYYNLIDDLIVFRPVAFFPAPVPPGTPSRLAPFNTNDEEAYGVEAEVDYLFTETLSGFVNYAYGERHDRDSNQRILTAPQNKLNAGVRVSTASGISGMLWLNYMDEVEFGGGRVDDYVLVNGQVSFPLGDGPNRVFLQGFNLLDDKHREHPEAQEYGVILMAGVTLTW